MRDIYINSNLSSLKNSLVATEASNLKVMSTIFLLVCVLSLNDSTCQITKNVFYFT